MLKNEDSRFYFGWALIVIIFGLSLIVGTSAGSFVLAGTIFFVGLGLATMLIGSLNPVLPLLVLFGFISILVGLLMYGIFGVSLNPILILGLTVIAIGVAMIAFLSKRGPLSD